MGLKGYDDFLPPEGAKVLTIRGSEPSPAPPAEAPASEPKPSKYHNKKTRYGGLLYDSKAEADYAQLLDLQMTLNPGMWWIRQPTFRLGVPENVYRPDFLVVRPDLAEPAFVIDVKGVETAKFRRDVKLWSAYGPCRLCIIRRVGKGWTCEIIYPQGGGN